jgi:hypothetical protein
MNKSLEKMLSSKWKNILLEYEKVKRKKSTHFQTVTALCDAHGVSRKQLHKYYSRWVSMGRKDEALLPRKRGPRRGQYRILSKEQRVLVKIQREFEAKPLDVWCMVKGVWDVHPSVKTIARTLKRYPRPKKKEIIHRYEKNIPGELIHGDTFNLPKNLFKDSIPRYLFGVVDDCTRLTYVQVIEHKRALDCTKAFMKCGKWYDLHGIEVESIMTDNGSEFTLSRTKKQSSLEKHVFESQLHLLEIKHKYTRPYRPQTNGKIERFWRILRDEFLAGIKDLETEEVNEKLKDFMYYFNYVRPHGGIKYSSPLEKLKFVTETLV